MSDEDDKRLERVRQELDRRGLVLGLQEIAPEKWRADSWPKSSPPGGGASSATGAGDSKAEAAEQLLALLDKEAREAEGL